VSTCKHLEDVGSKGGPAGLLSEVSGRLLSHGAQTLPHLERGTRMGAELHAFTHPSL
jgi:hypothetical protein